VALGCVIRDETGHYDIIAGKSARALMDLSVTRRLRLANGILMVENDKQARTRDHVNKFHRSGRGRASRVLHQEEMRGGLIMRKTAERSTAGFVIEPASSSGIRAALEAGDIDHVNRLLGYRWFVRSEVRHGDKWGRALEYPTANMRLPDDCRLRHGIYAVRASVDGASVDGVASFGRRPTFDNGAPLLEVHLFVFSEDLYGRVLDVEFISWIRGEERFETIEALIAQMDRDAADAQRMLREDRTPSIFNSTSEGSQNGA
jgi:riboflavin kinase/FMN adenylyltransferase